MQRRLVVKNIALTIGASIVLPAWANAWNKESFQYNYTNISTFQDNLLAEIVETIIPKTNTPGAKELNIHSFVSKMVMDCYDKKAQDIYAKGFDLVDNNAKNTSSKSFMESDGKQRLEILNKMSKSNNSDEKDFVQLVKTLTIQGYLNSEYVMTNLKVYEYAPARYHGCVPVQK